MQTTCASSVILIRVHRIWYTGGQWAYISALPPGFSDDIFIIVDMSDPTDVFVDENGLTYCTDSNAGPYIMEMDNL